MLLVIILCNYIIMRFGGGAAAGMTYLPECNIGIGYHFSDIMSGKLMLH